MNKFTGITSGGATIPIWDKAAHEEISGKQDALSTAQLNAISSVSGKQDKLTAGEHISIVNNVISVSGELGKIYSGTGYVNVDNANDTIGLNAAATSAISSINGSYDLSAGDNITFTTSGNTIYINGQQGGGSEYSAGPNINITDHIISGKSWQNEIAVATEGKADLSAIYDLSAGDNITIVQSGDGYVINSTGGGSEYSAGSNINITDNVISGKDWTDDISVATEGKADLSAIYDLSAGDNITIVQSGDGYVINSTGGGSEIPSALSGRWEDTSDTVETMSGAWGGSALPVSAGPGIKVELVDDKLVFSNDETVLWENVNGVAPGGTTKIGTLSEPLSNFKTYAIDVSFENLYPWKRNVFDVPHNWSSATNVPGVYFMGVTHANSLKPQESNALYDSFNTFGIGENMSDFYSLGSKVFNNGSVMPSVTGLSYVYKVVGINRIAGGN